MARTFRFRLPAAGLAGLAGLALVAALATGILHSTPATAAGTAAADSGDGSKELVGQAAPAFTAETLDGRTMTLSELKGKVVVLGFWKSITPAPLRRLGAV